MKNENNVPFNVNDIKNSVVFEEIKCENDEEIYYACDMAKSEKDFEEIIKAIKQ
jgi:hypothetical protein